MAVTRTRRLCCLGLMVLFVAPLQIARCQPGVGHRFISPRPVDQDSAATTTSSNGERNTLIAETHDFFGVFDQLGTSWYSILQIIRMIVQSAGGTTTKQDTLVDDLPTALTYLKQNLIPDEWDQSSEHSHGIPLSEFGKSMDDLYLSFLRWSAADTAEDGANESRLCKLEGGVNGGGDDKINVSKAYRRLERYMEWMKTARDDLVDPSITVSSLLPLWDAFHMKLTYDDCDRLVWWLDLTLVDLSRIQNEFSPRDITRLFVWLAHFMMFNPKAQSQGIVFFAGMNHVPFWDFMTMLPVELGMQLDSFVISVIPLKTKFVVLYDRPAWAKFAFQLIKPFLMRNMRQRVIVIEDGLYEHGFVKDVLGRGPRVIPSGIDFFSGGSQDADILGPVFEKKPSMWKALGRKG